MENMVVDKFVADNAKVVFLHEPPRQTDGVNNVPALVFVFY